MPLSSLFTADNKAVSVRHRETHPLSNYPKQMTIHLRYHYYLKHLETEICPIYGGESYCASHLFRSFHLNRNWSSKPHYPFRRPLCLRQTCCPACLSLSTPFGRSFVPPTKMRAALNAHRHLIKLALEAAAAAAKEGRQFWSPFPK